LNKITLALLWVFPVHWAFTFVHNSKDFGSTKLSTLLLGTLTVTVEIEEPSLKNIGTNKKVHQGQQRS